MIGAFATSARGPGANNARGDVDALSFKLTRQLGRIAAALLPPLLETSLVGIEDLGALRLPRRLEAQDDGDLHHHEHFDDCRSSLRLERQISICTLPYALLVAHRAGSPPSEDGWGRAEARHPLARSLIQCGGSSFLIPTEPPRLADAVLVR